MAAALVPRVSIGTHRQVVEAVIALQAVPVVITTMFVIRMKLLLVVPAIAGAAVAVLVATTIMFVTAMKPIRLARAIAGAAVVEADLVRRVSTGTVPLA